MGLDLIHIMPVKKGESDDGYYLFSAEELAESPGFVAAFKDCLVESGDGYWQLYYKTIGYQRKGVNRQFYEDFDPDELFFQLADVIKAYDCLQGDHSNSVAELKRNFQANFIDNFVDGKSIFVVSY